MEGHVEGMLDRDQRTAKLRFPIDSDSGSVPKTYRVHQDRTVTRARHCCCPPRTKNSSGSSNSSHLACRNGYLLNTFQSVTNVLIVVCITLVTLPKVSSMPVSMADRMQSRQKWINPCDTISAGDSSESVKPAGFNTTELAAVISEANSSLRHAESFKTSFVNETIGSPFKDILKGKNLNWLQLNLPKSQGEEVAEDHLNNLKIDDVLLDSYSNLQRVAVGLEQVTWDHQDNNTTFANILLEAEQHLKRLLCEVDHLIVEHKMERPEDVTREIFALTERTVDSTGEKNTRNWIIFREYMNILEYINQALEHLKAQLSER